MTTHSSQIIGVGLIGFGTVGSGVAKLLKDEAARYQRATGKHLVIRRVLVRDSGKAQAAAKAAATVSPDLITASADEFFTTPHLDVVIEVAGGIKPTGDLVRRALNEGKPVVTANKTLLAHDGPSLFALARAKGTHIAFEASCGGGIPCILALTLGLQANNISGLFGILNGTTNYILSQMASGGRSYAEALKGAQDLGYAEADPTADVSGEDAKQKLCILSSIAFGVKIAPAGVPCEGIERLDKVDFHYGAEMGYAIKLLATAERWPGQKWVCVQVRPCFVKKTALIAQVQGGFNALSVIGHATGHTMYYGAGAGSLPTASAVVSDLLSTVSGVAGTAFRNLGFAPDLHEEAPIINTADTESPFYLRLKANDRPGVIAQVTKILGDHGVSISGVLQHTVAQGEAHVPLVITTHQVRQGTLEKAAAEIEKLEAIADKPMILRIVELPA